MKLRPISQVTSRMGAVLLLCIILMAACSPIYNWMEQNVSYFLSTPLIYALRLLAFLLPCLLYTSRCVYETGFQTHGRWCRWTAW